MGKTSLAVKILVGFGLGTAVGLGLSEFASPETVKKILPWISPFGNFLSIIVFAIAFGLLARVVIDTSKDESVVRSVRLMLDVVSGAEKVAFKMIECVVLYFPYGVFALTVSNFARNGTLLFGPYARITLAVVGVAGMIFVIYPIAIGLFCRQNPIPVMLKMQDTMLTAFVTRSSAAALPVSFRTMDDLGVDRALSAFSLPLGATVNMNGVCIHLPVFVVLAANLFGHSLGGLIKSRS